MIFTSIDQSKLLLKRILSMAAIAIPSPTIFFKTGKIRKSVSAIHIWLHGNQSLPDDPDRSVHFLENLRGIYPLTVGERAVLRKEEAEKLFLPWRNWKTA